MKQNKDREVRLRRIKKVHTRAVRAAEGLPLNSFESFDPDAESELNVPWDPDELSGA